MSQVEVQSQDQRQAEADLDQPDPRRPSIEKLPILTDSDFEDDLDDDPSAAAFHKLPEEIIQQ